MFNGLTPPYDCICAEPPWRFSSNSLSKPGRNPCRHFACMTPAGIAALPVAELAGADCVLFLWSWQAAIWMLRARLLIVRLIAAKGKEVRHEEEP